MARFSTPWFRLARHDETDEEKAAREAAEAKAAEEEAAREQENRKGGDKQILADLARERDARQAAQKAAKEAQAAREAAEAKVKEFEDRDKTELEKAQAERDAAIKTATEAADRAKREALRSAVVAEAAKAGAVAPEQIVALLPADAVTVNDDGTVEGAADAVKTFLDANKHFKSTKPGGTIDQGNREDDPVDFRKADRKAVDAELSKMGVSRW